MTAKTPSASGISRLLASAGFERSNYGRPGVMWPEVTDGFSVWKSHHANAPQQPFVAVQHVARSMQDSYDYEWPAVKAAMLAKLEEYAAVIRAAGYPALARDRGEEPPWLTILTVLAAKNGDDR